MPLETRMASKHTFFGLIIEDEMFLPSFTPYLGARLTPSRFLSREILWSLFRHGALLRTPTDVVSRLDYGCEGGREGARHRIAGGWGALKFQN